MRKKCKYMLPYYGNEPFFVMNKTYYYDNYGRPPYCYRIYSDNESTEILGQFTLGYFEIMFSTVVFDRKNKIKKINSINER